MRREFVGTFPKKYLSEVQAWAKGRKGVVIKGKGLLQPYLGCVWVAPASLLYSTTRDFNTFKKTLK